MEISILMITGKTGTGNKTEKKGMIELGTRKDTEIKRKTD